MKRLNFTFDQATIDLLDELSSRYFRGNKSRTVRAALENLEAHISQEGWVVAGYVPSPAETEVSCHTCGDSYERGEVLFRPVFEKGSGPDMRDRIPSEVWLDCAACLS